jgi:hypothetical protein
MRNGNSTRARLTLRKLSRAGSRRYSSTRATHLPLQPVAARVSRAKSKPIAADTAASTRLRLSYGVASSLLSSCIVTGL